MNILTPSGYKDISLVNIGDEVIGYDFITNSQVTNILLDKQEWTPSMDDYADNHGDFTVYTINGTYTFYKDQSIFIDQLLVHVSELQIGDIIYDDNHNPITITSISSSLGTSWWRLEISGDHFYIADGILLHNAARFWIGGGTNTNWNASPTFNWSATSGGTIRASVPGSADDVTFDGAGVNGNTVSVISAAITIKSLNITSSYTSTVTHNALLTIAGNLTLTTAYTIAGTGAITISAASTIASGGKVWPNSMTFSNNNTKVLNGNLSITGSLSISGITTINATASETLTVAGGLTITNTVTSNVKFILTGGTASSTQFVNSSIDINGNVTFSTFSWNGTNNKTLKYVSGTVNFGTSTLFVQSPVATPGNIDLGSTCIPYTMEFNSTFSINLLSELNISNIFNILTTATFGGTAGFNIGTFRIKSVSSNENSSAAIITLKADSTITYKAKYLQNVMTVPGYSIMKSSIPGTRAKFIVTETSVPGAQMASNIAFTDIDASGGFPIFSFADPYLVYLTPGTDPNNNNIYHYQDVKTVAKPIFNC